MLNNKIDFIMTITVDNANPNGDPLAGNMPRTDSKGYGEMSDVSIKRKIRNRMQDLGNEIFVKSRDRTDDGFSSLQERYESVFNKNNSDEEVERGFCEKWLDVRSFGQVITYGNRSIGIRGPVSIGIAKSLEPVEITTMQITRSTNSMKPKGKSSRSADTMGSKHVIEQGTYVINGAVNCFYSEKTGFDEKDLEVLKEALRTLFINDVSSARPEGSMEVRDIFWFKHSSKIGDVSSAKIKDLLVWNDNNSLKEKYEDYDIHLDKKLLAKYEEKGLQVQQIEGL